MPVSLRTKSSRWPGEDVVSLVKEEASHSGIGTFLMQGLSRMFETEEVYADHDFKLASARSRFPGRACRR